MPTSSTRSQQPDRSSRCRQRLKTDPLATEHVSWRVPMDVICGAARARRRRPRDLRPVGHSALRRDGGRGRGVRRSLGPEEDPHRRRSPSAQCAGTSLIGRILPAEGDAISDNDLAGLVDGIVTGGYETTASWISWHTLGTMMLLRAPAHAAIVRGGSRANIDGLVEELLHTCRWSRLPFRGSPGGTWRGRGAPSSRATSSRSRTAQPIATRLRRSGTQLARPREFPHRRTRGVRPRDTPLRRNRTRPHGTADRSPDARSAVYRIWLSLLPRNGSPGAGSPSSTASRNIRSPF